jgi:hypothetical protein
VEHGADEALCFSVCLGPVGAGAEVAEAESAAGEGVEGGSVAGAVVGEHPLNLDAVSAVKGDRALEKADRCRRPLVLQDLGVGHSAVVVDRDVHELLADGVADPAGRVGVLGVVGRVTLPADALARTTDDPAELFDVDMDELART